MAFEKLKGREPWKTAAKRFIGVVGSWRGKTVSAVLDTRDNKIVDRNTPTRERGKEQREGAEEGAFHE